MDLTCTSAFVRRLSGRGSIGGRGGGVKRKSIYGRGGHTDRSLSTLLIPLFVSKMRMETREWTRLWSVGRLIPSSLSTLSRRERCQSQRKPLTFP